MNFNASSWSIRRPVPTLVLFLVLTLAGISGFLQLGIDANPNIDLPYVTIKTTYSGAGPEELEAQFTRKVEDAVAGLSDVEEIYSGISDGQAYTNVRFALEADSDNTLDEVRIALDRIREELTPYAESMTIQKLRYDDGAVLTYAIRSDQRSVEALSNWVDLTIAPEIMAVKGVAEVRRIGGVDREIRVDLDPYQLDAYGVSAARINRQVQDFNLNLPGGRSEVGGQEQSIRVLGEFPDAAAGIAALNSLEIVLPTGKSVPLQTLAQVTDGFADRRQSATVNNQPVISFAVFRSNGSLLVSVEEGVKAAIARIEESTLPEDIQLKLIFTRATDVREAYRASIEALILGSLLAVAVVGFFLKNWRTTLITAAALPLSIIPTFIVINALGYSLNSMTLLALTLAVGNLVDDAIVEIENIERHISKGKTPTQAALDSSAEVGLAVVTTTATIVAVFIPVAFMGGIPGQFFKPFGVTVAVSTMFSTLVARLITPLLASKLLKPVNPELSTDSLPISSVAKRPNLLAAEQSRISPYHTLLHVALHHRLVTLTLAIAIFLASLTLIPRLPTGLYGAGNTDLSHLSLELPPGTSFKKAASVTGLLSDRILTHPAVESIYVDQQTDTADVVIRLKPQRRISRQAFEQQVRQQLQTLPNLRSSFDSQSASGSDKALNIVLKSADAASLTQMASQVAQQMRQLTGLVEVSTSTGLVRPELLIIPNPQQAVDQGIQLRDIATTATLATLGDTDANLPEIDVGDRQIPIRVRLARKFRSQLQVLSNLKIESTKQQLVPLSAVADITIGGGPAEITRFDRERQVTISANLNNITLGQALEAVYALPALQTLPPEISEQTTGDADILQDVFKRFTLALSTAILMIYAVLVLLYNSFIYPLAVMSSLPLSVGGTFLALLLANKPLDLYALIGIVLLMGLVTKNSILLVDYALQAHQQGLSLKQAAIQSGITRMRPILMTSTSTVAGMVPITLEIGAGGEVRSPMAIAVIGGFSTATLLTLVVVPVCFTYMADLQQRLSNLPQWLGQLFRRSAPTHQPQIHQSQTHTARSSNGLMLAYAGMQTANSAQRSDYLEKGNPQNKLSTESAVSNNLAYIEQNHPLIEQPSSEKASLTCTIACIENDFSTLCHLHEYLDHTIFSIISVDDPIVALTDLTTHTPDIILVTLSMPGLNGFQVCDRLRKSPTFRTTPILLLAPQSTWWQRLKAKWHGASGCISKPLDRTQLLVQLFLLMV
ncbi:MAG: efflux RND transporter permease subunit [Phormidesmis sp.]